MYSVSLFDFSVFLPRRLDSNFGCLPAWVKNGKIEKTNAVVLEIKDEINRLYIKMSKLEFVNSITARENKGYFRRYYLKFSSSEVLLQNKLTDIERIHRLFLKKRLPKHFEIMYNTLCYKLFVLSL